MSDLPSSGFTHTDTASHAWCLARANEIREMFQKEIESGDLIANIFPYRHHDQQYMALDFWDGSRSNKEAYPITFNVGCSLPRFDNDTDPCVVDVVEALHLAGIILASLGVKATVGRQCNEINPECLSEPLKPGQTNGMLRIHQ